MKYLLSLALLLSSIGITAQTGKISAAKTAFSTGKLDVAKKAIDAAVAHQKTMNNAEAWLYRALIYASYDNEALFAIELTASLAKDKPADAFATVIASLDKAMSLNPEEGELLTRASTEIPGTYFNNTLDAYKANNHDKVIEVGDQFLQIAQKFDKVENEGILNLLVGEAYRSKDNLEESLPFYKRAVELGEEQEVSYQVLSNYYYNNDMADEYYTIVAVAKEKFPDNQEYLLNEIQFRTNHGASGEELMTMLKKAHEINPSNVTVISQIGSQYSKQEKWEKAKEWYEKALAIEPENKYALFEISAYYLDKAGEAQKTMNFESSESSPVYLQAKKDKEMYTQQAWPTCDKLYKLVPDDFTALAVMEKYYRLKGDNKKADDFMKKKEAASN